MVGVPVIALYELWFGIKKSARQSENRSALLAFLSLNIALWPFDADDAEEAGDIRAALARAARLSAPTTFSSPPKRAAGARSWSPRMSGIQPRAGPEDGRTGRPQPVAGCDITPSPTCGRGWGAGNRLLDGFQNAYALLLVWRGKDFEPDPLKVDAPPIYVQEKIKPRQSSKTSPADERPSEEQRSAVRLLPRLQRTTRLERRLHVKLLLRLGRGSFSASASGNRIDCRQKVLTWFGCGSPTQTRIGSIS